MKLTSMLRRAALGVLATGLLAASTATLAAGP